MTQPIPEGYTSVTPCLTLKNCERAIETYKKALGAKELNKLMCPETGKVMHAELQIGNSRIMVQDDFPGQAVTPASLFVYTEDCDAALKRAKEAGMTETMPAEDMFWGDRLAAVKDENGVQWSLATHIKDVSMDDIKTAAKAWAKKMIASQDAA